MYHLSRIFGQLQSFFDKIFIIDHTFLIKKGGLNVYSWQKIMIGLLIA